MIIMIATEHFAATSVSPSASRVIGSLPSVFQLYLLNAFQSAIPQQSWRDM